MQRAQDVYRFGFLALVGCNGYRSSSYVLQNCGFMQRLNFFQNCRNFSTISANCSYLAAMLLCKSKGKIEGRKIVVTCDVVPFFEKR